LKEELVSRYREKHCLRIASQNISGTDLSAYPAERLLGDAKIGGDIT
jgi:hypothetical protein